MFKKKLMTIVICDVLKLISITFSKMLFLFIISSLFLPHSEFIAFPRQNLLTLRLLMSYIYIYIYIYDRLCGLVVRVSGYRYGGPGFDSRRYQIF